jgi:hypothetical protein
VHVPRARLRFSDPRSIGVNPPPKAPLNNDDPADAGGSIKAPPDGRRSPKKPNGRPWLMACEINPIVVALGLRQALPVDCTHRTRNTQCYISHNVVQDTRTHTHTQTHTRTQLPLRCDNQPPFPAASKSNAETYSVGRVRQADSDG